MTIYVDDTASGANNGTSWADAFASILSADGAGSSAGDEVWVAHTHDEQIASNIALNFSGGTFASPIKLISVNSGTDAYAIGARVESTTGDVTLSGQFLTFGVTFANSDDLFIADGSNDYQIYEDCTFDCTDGFVANDIECSVWFKNCTINIADTTSAMQPKTESLFRITGGAVTHSGSADLISALDNCIVLIEDCDLSSHATDILLASGASDGYIDITLRRCKLHATTALGVTIASPHMRVLVDSCTDGTITAPELGITTLYTYWGTLSSTLAVYRTDGANDGENANAYSWEMISNANAVEQFAFLESPPVARWVDPDTSPSGATAQGIVTSTRMALRGTPAALTTDSSSTWNGSGVGTKQKITHTLNNQDGATLTVYVASGGTLNDDDFWIEVQEPDQVGGPIIVRFYLAKPSTTVYVDPRLEVA